MYDLFSSDTQYGRLRAALSLEVKPGNTRSSAKAAAYNVAHPVLPSISRQRANHSALWERLGIAMEEAELGPRPPGTLARPSSISHRNQFCVTIFSMSAQPASIQL
jgi:hypothetical protein